MPLCVMRTSKFCNFCRPNQNQSNKYRFSEGHGTDTSHSNSALISNCSFIFNMEHSLGQIQEFRNFQSL